MATPITVYGDVDARAVEQLERCATAGGALKGVLCADGHVGYSQPIGGAVAYPDHISPSGVGFDIGCGTKACRTDLLVDDVRGEMPRIMDEVFGRISFGVGRRNEEPVDHPVLDRIRHADFEPQRRLRDLAARQLGTVGAGNHYVDLFEGDDRHVWIGVHFGSRGFGHKTASGFMALAQGLPFEGHARQGGMDSPPVLLRTDSELGRSYIAAMQLAGEYAYAGRDTVVEKVLEILGAESTYEVHNHHNFCIAGDQIVPTTQGPKRMDDIKAGDEVYAYTGEGPDPTRVVDAWASGEKPIYTISLGSRRIRCSGSHPLLVLSDGIPVWRNAEDLTEGDVVACADGYYPTSSSWGVERARLVGAFLGDGWIRQEGVKRRGYSLGLAIGTRADPHTDRYASLVAEQLPNTGWGHGWRIDAPGHYGLSCSSKSAWTAVVEMGLGARSEAKRVPRDAFLLQRDEKLALLAGYIDADGTVANDSTSNHGRGHIASVSRGLVEDLRELAIACGLQVTSIHTDRRETNFGTCMVHRFTIASGSMIEIPLWHRAKVANVRVGVTRRTKGLSAQYLAGAVLPEKTFARRVRSIEVGLPEPVYDLTVEHESHSFIVEGVVTHNCWRENHFGTDVWVVRKGCTPAFPGQEGFVGATMGEPSVILRGKEGDASSELLYSTVHGAGRVMSRTQAAGKRRKGKTVKPGLIDYGAVREELAAGGIELRGGAADEAPGAYKRLDAVLAAHAETIEVVHRLRPIGVAMAGADTFDPYRD